MTQQFENFVNAALDKSLSSDVTLPTADEIPVFTGIGRQVTGKTKAELGLATSSQLTDKADLVDGLVPANQLPGYVDDVLEYANLASFPLLGEASKLYIAIDTNLVYRWGGSTYAVTSSSLALGETSTTAYYGDKGKTAYDHSQATGNPHNLPAASTGADGYLTSTDWNTFNGKLGLADVRFAFVSDSGTTYTVPESAVTAVGRTIIELSNSSLGSITINAATGTGKSVGDSVNICITGVYNAQVLVGSGATLQGDLTFSYQHHTKTLVYKGSNTWTVVGQAMYPLGVLNRKIDLATLLELRFEGSNGSQVFTDSSVYNRSVTVGSGTPTLTTTSPLSGTSSLLLGTNGTITTPDFTTPVNTNLSTIEFRIQIDLADIAFNESQGVFIKGYSFAFAHNYSHQCILTRNASGTGGAIKMFYDISTVATISAYVPIAIADLSANNHIAFTRRANGTFIGYLNGVQVAFLFATDYTANTLAIEIGASLYNWHTATQTTKFKGLLDNFKLSNVDRYPTNFTPPTQENKM